MFHHGLKGRAKLRSEVAVTLAGPLAEAKFAGTCHGLDNGGDMADIIEYGSQLTPAELNASIDRASRVVDDHWQTIMRLAHAIYRHGTLAGADLEKAIKRARRRVVALPAI